jgi:hypothetical protein
MAERGWGISIFGLEVPLKSWSRAYNSAVHGQLTSAYGVREPVPVVHEGEVVVVAVALPVPDDACNDEVGHAEAGQLGRAHLMGQTEHGPRVHLLT